MAQNITLMGANYSAVPGVQLPKTGGGTALFTDVTDTTAAAADVASGKYFYTAAGVRTEGTNAGGGSVSQDAQGYIVLPSTGGSDYTTATVTINNPDTMAIFVPRLFSYGGLDYINAFPFTEESGTFIVPLYKGSAVIMFDYPYIVTSISGSVQDVGGALHVTGNASFTVVADPDA